MLEILKRGRRQTKSVTTEGRAVKKAEYAAATPVLKAAIDRVVRETQEIAVTIQFL
jgi:hypothetical protein